MMDKEFKQLILDFIVELNAEYSFNISIDRILKFFEIYGEYDLFDEDEMKMVLKSLFCTSSSQLEIFDKVFDSYFYDLKNKTKYNLEKQIIKSKLENLEQKYENVKQSLDNVPISYSDADFYLDYERFFPSFIIISKNLEFKTDKDILDAIFKGNKGALIEYWKSLKSKNLRQEKIKLLENDIEDILLYNIENNINEEMSSFLLDLIVYVKNIINTFESQEEFHMDMLNNISKEIKVIKKISSTNHRNEFTKGKNAVQTEQGYLYKDIAKLNDNDIRVISQYIKKNAIKFKTKLSKNLKIKGEQRFDYKKVIRNSIKTDMTPMELFYKKQPNRRIKVVCITDISGSCKAASQVLLLFVYSLQEAFPGGVESFVFVKQIEDATNIFKNYSFTEANERTSVLVERDYSDYHNALKQFDEKFFYKITKDTIVIYLGDARNNKNDSGSEYLERIRNKVTSGYGKMYWINPEEKWEWNTGDSIISEYGKYMDDVICARNTKDLIEFLNTIKV